MRAKPLGKRCADPCQMRGIGRELKAIERRPIAPLRAEKFMEAGKALVNVAKFGLPCRNGRIGRFYACEGLRIADACLSQRLRMTDPFVMRAANIRAEPRCSRRQLVPQVLSGETSRRLLVIEIPLNLAPTSKGLFGACRLVIEFSQDFSKAIENRRALKIGVADCFLEQMKRSNSDIDCQLLTDRDQFADRFVIVELVVNALHLFPICIGLARFEGRKGGDVHRVESSGNDSIVPGRSMRSVLAFPVLLVLPH
ncbi:hypothetical protein DIE15_19230 [Burkholderia sp. Bp9031]|nr:hypothetical protein DIE15_19230 [Burkholderia sp. Bp9031]